MLLWLTDLMNTTEEVTIHRPNVSTLLFSAFIRGDLNSKIITTNRRYHQRLCLEAWHINSAHAPLNRDDGGLLPDAYLHLVRKTAAN